MKEKEIYDSLVESKKKNSRNIKLYIISCTVIVGMVLFFAFGIVIKTFNKLQVIDKKGNHYPSELTTREKVLETTIAKFCSEIAYYANTFDRNSLKENQARTKFIMEEKSVFRLWSFYKKENHYYDATQRGFSYKGVFKKIIKSDLTKKPYEVQFIGEVEIYEGARLTKKLPFIAKGIIASRTAKFPEAYLGWYMTDYLQNFKRID